MARYKTPEEMNARQREYFLGMSVLCGLILVLAILVVVPGIPNTLTALIMGTLFVGFYVWVFYHDRKLSQKESTRERSSMMDVLSQIQPDQMLETNKFVVAKKSDVYIVLPNNTFELFFIRFHRPKERSSIETRQPRLPRLISISPLTLLRKISSLGHIVKEVDNIRVARIWGEFKIPTAMLQTGKSRYAVRWVEGPGLLYLLGRYEIGSGFAGRFVDVLDGINHYTVLRIIEELSRDSQATTPSLGEEPSYLETKIPSGTRAQVCGVCKSIVNPGEEVVYCPHCGAKAHRPHMLEWIHVKGVCPVCSEDVNEEELVHEFSEHKRRRRVDKGSAE